MTNNIKLRREECFAKLVAEKIFKNSSFKIEDKPDLQDKKNNIGIEVICFETTEVSSLFQKYIRIEDENIKEKLKEKIDILGGIIVGDGALITISLLDSQKFLLAFQKKLLKLQSNYTIFNENDLMIIYNFPISEYNLESKLLNDMINQQETFNYKFNKVIAVAIDEICIFNLKDINVQKIKIKDINDLMSQTHKLFKGESNE